MWGTNESLDEIIRLLDISVRIALMRSFLITIRRRL